MERIELPNGWYLEKYRSVKGNYLFDGYDFWGLSRPTGGFVAESWSEALALDFAAAMNAQAARIERLEKGLREITAIPNNQEGGDWDEIQLAREIASEALVALKDA